MCLASGPTDRLTTRTTLQQFTIQITIPVSDNDNKTITGWVCLSDQPKSMHYKLPTMCVFTLDTGSFCCWTSCGMLHVAYDRLLTCVACAAAAAAAAATQILNRVGKCE